MGLNHIVIAAPRDCRRALDVVRRVNATSFAAAHFGSLESVCTDDMQTERVVLVFVPEEDPDAALRYHARANAKGLPVSFCYCVDEISLPSIVRALQMGAIDVFDHNVSSPRLDEILRKGFSLLRMRQEEIQAIREAREYVDGLTERQRELLLLLLNGSTNKAAAAAMHISIKTIEKHRQIIIRKARVNNLVEIANVFTMSQRSIAEASAYVPAADQRLTIDSAMENELVR